MVILCRHAIRPGGKAKSEACDKLSLSIKSPAAPQSTAGQLPLQSLPRGAGAKHSLSPIQSPSLATVLPVVQTAPETINSQIT